MDAADHLTHLEADIARVLALPDDAMGNDVAACPGWTVTELVEHCAGVFNFASTNIDLGPGADPDYSPAFDAAGLGGTELFAREAERLVGNLRALDPSEHRPNWAGAPESRWYFRRMAQELAVHRWDAQLAVGDPDPIDAALAVDGVDELFDVFVVPYAARRGALGAGETVHLHATDDDLDGGEWMITFGADAVEVTHEHGKGDMAGRGTASDLLLFGWNRRPVDITTFGDTDLFAFWSSKIAI